MSLAGTERFPRSKVDDNNDDDDDDVDMMWTGSSIEMKGDLKWRSMHVKIDRVRLVVCRDNDV